MQKCTHCACLFLCIFIHTGGIAQDCHQTLRGHITESATHEPLAYATVYIKEAARGAMTDEQGYFAIVNLCAGTQYTVEVSHVECAHLTQIVALKENMITDLELQHNAVLKEVIIKEKASAAASVQAGSKVNTLELEASRGLNLGETLRKLPGVSIMNTGATIAKPVIQGLHSNRIAIVSNGVTLQSQQWGSDHAPEIDPFSASQVSVIKGASAVRYGVGALGGVIVLDPAPLREQAGMGGWATVNGFSNGRSGVVAGAVDWHPTHRNIAFRLQGTFKRAGNLRAPDYYLGNTGVQEINGSALAGWQRGHWKHTASVSRFDQRLGVLRAAHIGNTTDLNLAIQSDTPRNNLNLFDYTIARPFQSVQHNTLKYKGIYRISDIWSLSAQYNFQYDHRQEYDRVRSAGAASDKPQVSFRLWSNTADVAIEHLPVHHWQGSAGVQLMQQLNYVGRGGYIPDYLTLGAAVWAIERWRRYPIPWEFEIGGRFDYRWNEVTYATGTFLPPGTSRVNNLHFGNVSGTTGLIYHINSKFKTTLYTGYAWRPPHIYELFARGVHFATAVYEEGNKALQSEKAWNSNLALSWESNKLAATVSVFRNQIAQFIYLQPRPDTFVLTTRGAFLGFDYTQANAVLQGVDGQVSWSVLPNWSIESRWSVLRGMRKVKKDTITDQPDNRSVWLPLMPSDRLQYGVKWSSKVQKFKGSKVQGIKGSRNQEFKGSEVQEIKSSRDQGFKAKEDAEVFIQINATTVFQQIRLPETGLIAPPPAGYTLIGLDAGWHIPLLKGQRVVDIGLAIQNMANIRYRDYLDFFRYFADAPGINIGLRVKYSF